MAAHTLTSSTAHAAALQAWATAFRNLHDASAQDPSIAGLRRQAFGRFRETGFPKTTLEDWRFTPLDPLPIQLFARPTPPAAWDGRLPSPLDLFSSGQIEGPRLVFLDGRFRPECSTTGPDLAGFQAGSLADALRSGDPTLRRHLASIRGVSDHPFANLDLALFEDGAFLRLPPGAAPKGIVQLFFLFTSPPSPSAADQPLPMSHIRNLIILEEGAQLRWFEYHGESGEGQGASLSNVVTEYLGGRGSLGERIEAQGRSAEAFHFAGFHGRLEAEAGLTSHVLAQGGALARHDLEIVLDGERAQGRLFGLSLGTGQQRIGHHTSIRHAKPHGQSGEMYKGIWGGRSRGVFNGKILVLPGAQKTDAKQGNRNLLLTPGARVDSKPQLEIFADDVRCTHGATLGRLDREALFYLRARGLASKEARRLLTEAFAGEVLAQIGPVALAGWARDWTGRRLAGILEEIHD